MYFTKLTHIVRTAHSNCLPAVSTLVEASALEPKMLIVWDLAYRETEPDSVACTGVCVIPYDSDIALDIILFEV